MTVALSMINTKLQHLGTAQWPGQHKIDTKLQHLGTAQWPGQLKIDTKLQHLGTAQWSGQHKIDTKLQHLEAAQWPGQHKAAESCLHANVTNSRLGMHCCCRPSLPATRQSLSGDYTDKCVCHSRRSSANSHLSANHRSRLQQHQTHARTHAHTHTHTHTRTHAQEDGGAPARGRRYINGTAVCYQTNHLWYSLLHAIHKQIVWRSMHVFNAVVVWNDGKWLLYISYLHKVKLSCIRHAQRISITSYTQPHLKASCKQPLFGIDSGLRSTTLWLQLPR